MSVLVLLHFASVQAEEVHQLRFSISAVPRTVDFYFRLHSVSVSFSVFVFIVNRLSNRIFSIPRELSSGYWNSFSLCQQGDVAQFSYVKRCDMLRELITQSCVFHNCREAWSSSSRIQIFLELTEEYMADMKSKTFLTGY